MVHYIPKVGLRVGILFSVLGLVVTPSRAERAFDHSLWDSILKEAVHDGVVDYGKIQARYGDLQKYLKSLETADVAGLPRNEQLAFYINAYNAHCINGVLSHGKIRSVRDVTLFFKRTRFILAGKKMSLDSLEHQVLRKMGDPRIHFAIVCASKSCPKLASHAYTGATLDEDLDRQAKDFFNDPSKNRLDHRKGVFYLSKILSWFKEDFTKKKPSVLTFVAPYLKREDHDFLVKNGNRIRVEFLDYDWSLNGHY